MCIDIKHYFVLIFSLTNIILKKESIETNRLFLLWKVNLSTEPSAIPTGTSLHHGGFHPNKERYKHVDSPKLIIAIKKPQNTFPCH